MRLNGQIVIHVRGETINRDPTLWEKLRRGMGGQVNLDTGQVRNQLEATAVVDGARRALGQLEVNNALSLVIDDQVIFQDSDGKTADLPDLVLALSEHSSVFGRGFRELRFAAEHEEAGLHLVIETRARTEHRRDEPAAFVTVGGRLTAFEPRKGEDAEQYRARVEPLVRDGARVETARLQFESFVGRLENALARMLPDAEVALKKAEAKLIKAKPGQLAPASAALSPTHPAYDPYLAYYPSPMGVMLDTMMIASFMSMMHPPHLFVSHASGAPIGSLDQVAANPDSVADDAPDPGVEASADDANDAAGADEGGFDGAGDADSGGGFDDGGGFDGGDFGGGDFGGFD